MPKINNQKLGVGLCKIDRNPSSGFTLTEILVVLSIMGVLLGVFLVNFAGLRGARNLKIAQNELVSNIRKMQSYALSSRVLSNGQPAQFFLLKLDTTNKRTYTLQAIYNVNVQPQLAAEVEKFQLPEGIVISGFALDRPPLAGGSDFYDIPPAPMANCVLLSSKLPFGKSLVSNGCDFSNFSSDAYAKLKDFVTNNPSSTVSDNSVLVIRLSTITGNLTKTVTVNGVSGTVTFEK